MLSNETYKLQGLANAGKMAGACDLLKTRIGALNGVIHVIDAVLLPPSA